MSRAFTLIELLIVVAIIAILAVIAVPNFLEAQTRSKVSRVRADHFALATALEAYRVNEMGYVNARSATGEVLAVYGTPGDLKVKFFVLFSHGPDRVRSLTADGKTFLQQDILLNPNRFTELIYDPTNGTTSNGEIFRAGGSPIGFTPSTPSQ